MPDNEERQALAIEAAEQMYRSLAAWGFGSVDKERVVSDLAKYTGGKIQLMPQDVKVSAVEGTEDRAKAKKKRK